MSRLFFTSTILINTNVGSPVYIGAYNPKGLSIEVPAIWTAADLVFEVSRDHNSRFHPETLVNWTRLDVSLVKVASILTASKQVYIAQPETWMLQNYTWIRPVSVDTVDGTAENQTAARTLIIGLLR